MAPARAPVHTRQVHGIQGNKVHVKRLRPTTLTAHVPCACHTTRAAVKECSIDATGAGRLCAAHACMHACRHRPSGASEGCRVAAGRSRSSRSSPPAKPPGLVRCCRRDCSWTTSGAIKAPGRKEQPAATMRACNEASSSRQAWLGQAARCHDQPTQPASQPAEIRTQRLRAWHACKGCKPAIATQASRARGRATWTRAPRFHRGRAGARPCTRTSTQAQASQQPVCLPLTAGTACPHWPRRPPRMPAAPRGSRRCASARPGQRCGR